MVVGVVALLIVVPLVELLVSDAVYTHVHDRLVPHGNSHRALAIRVMCAQVLVVLLLAPCLYRASA
jgi:hypothetical protein